MTPEAGLARPADGEDVSNKAPIDPDIDLHTRSPQGETATRFEAIVDNTAELRCGPMIEKLPEISPAGRNRRTNRHRAGL